MRITKPVLLVITILGIAGTVLFFPVKINSYYTCLYHKLFDGGDFYPQIFTGSQNANQTVTEMTDESDGEPVDERSDSAGLIDIYLQHYAFFWWGSLFLCALIVYFSVMKNRKKATHKFNKTDP